MFVVLGSPQSPPRRSLPSPMAKHLASPTRCTVQSSGENDDERQVKAMRRRASRLVATVAARRKYNARARAIGIKIRATRVIQTFFRKVLKLKPLRSSVAQWIQVRDSLPPDAPFEQVVEFIKNVKTVEAVEVLAGGDSKSFLAALMVTRYPDQVCSNHPVLLALAHRLMRCAETACLRPTVASLVALDACRCAWAKSLADWKHDDAHRLAQELLLVFVEAKVLETHHAKLASSSAPSVDDDVRRGYQNRALQAQRRAKALLPVREYRAWLSKAARLVREAETPVPGPSPSPGPGVLEALPSFDERCMYELLFDPEWRLPDIPPASETCLELGRNASDVAVRVLAQIASRIKALVPKRLDIQQRVDDALDSEVIAKQLAHGAFTQVDFVKLLYALQNQLEEVQTPLRVPATKFWIKALAQAPHSASLVAVALDRALRDVAQCERDVANVHLGLLARQIKRDPKIAARRMRESEVSPNSTSDMPGLCALALAGMASIAASEPRTASACLREGLLLLACGKIEATPEPLTRFDPVGLISIRRLAADIVFQAELETTLSQLLRGEGRSPLVELDVSELVEGQVIAHLQDTLQGESAPQMAAAVVERCFQNRGSSGVFRIIERHLCSALGKLIDTGSLDVHMLRRVGITSAKTLIAAGELGRLLHGMHRVLCVAYGDEVTQAINRPTETGEASSTCSKNSLTSRNCA